MKGPTRPVHGVVARYRVEATWVLLYMWQLSPVNGIARISQDPCGVVQIKLPETVSSEVTMMIQQNTFCMLQLSILLLEILLYEKCIAFFIILPSLSVSPITLIPFKVFD